MKIRRPGRTPVLAALLILVFPGCAGRPGLETAAPVAASPQAAACTEAIGEKAPRPGNEALRYGRPLADFEGGGFVGAWRCAVCHSRLSDRQGRDLSIADHWRATMMANGARDPLWQAKVASEAARTPALKKVIEEKCVSCHMPMAWREAAAAPGGTPADGIFAALLDGNSPLHAAALDGISCSLCHQIRDEQLGSEASFGGRFVLDLAATAPGRPIYGPYQQAVTRPMRTSVGYTPEFGSHTNDAALCATCHTLHTPFVNGAGEVAGQFPEQTVYLEWLHSAYAEPADSRHQIGETVAGVRTCQECHMPLAEGGEVMIANYAPPEAEPKEHFSQHHFVGGNLFMLNILQDNLGPLGLTASSSQFAATRERTRRQLQERSACLSVARIEKGADQLLVALRVENLVGHKLPTGFPSRRAWLHLLITDGAGATLFESGRPEADGRIAGDASEEPGGHEPHYQLITAPDQVQIYEAVMEDTEGGVTHTLLRGSGYRKDNRLLPRGFDKATAGADIAVHGRAAADADFTGGSDLVRYRVPLAGAAGPFTVRAELLYTPVSFGFVEDLRRDAALPLVGRFLRYYREADKTPVTIAAATATIP
jgi:hypothetical protein